MRAVNLLPAERRKGGEKSGSKTKLTPVHGAALAILLGAGALGYWGHGIRGEVATQKQQFAELEAQSTTTSGRHRDSEGCPRGRDRVDLRGGPESGGRAYNRPRQLVGGHDQSVSRRAERCLARVDCRDEPERRRRGGRTGYPPHPCHHSEGTCHQPDERRALPVAPFGNPWLRSASPQRRYRP